VGRRVWLVFKRDQLVYDIANMAYVESHVMAEEEEHGRHVLADVAEAGNVDRVTRVLDLAHAAAVEMLYPLTRGEVWCGESVSDELTEAASYCIELWLPEGFSRTTVGLLEKLVHEYMTARALADWLSVTKPEASANWAAKAEEAAREIDRAKHQRRGGLTRPMAPF